MGVKLGITQCLQFRIRFRDMAIVSQRLIAQGLIYSESVLPQRALF